MKRTLNHGPPLVHDDGASSSSTFLLPVAAAVDRCRRFLLVAAACATSGWHWHWHWCYLCDDGLVDGWELLLVHDVARRGARRGRQLAATGQRSTSGGDLKLASWLVDDVRSQWALGWHFRFNIDKTSLYSEFQHSTIRYCS